MKHWKNWALRRMLFLCSVDVNMKFCTLFFDLLIFPLCSTYLNVTKMKRRYWTKSPNLGLKTKLPCVCTKSACGSSVVNIKERSKVSIPTTLTPYTAQVDLGKWLVQSPSVVAQPHLDPFKCASRNLEVSTNKQTTPTKIFMVLHPLMRWQQVNIVNLNILNC